MNARLACLTVALLSSASFAIDPGLGNGGSGVLEVHSPATVVNRSGVLLSTTSQGSRALEVRSGVLDQGSLGLLIQLQTAQSLSGDGESLKLENSNLGRFEFVRAAQVSGTSVTLTAGLEHDWDATVTQVIFVPEYSAGSIDQSASLEAPPWDGQTGGVLALVVRGRLTVNGILSAEGRGFRGGLSMPIGQGEGLLSGSWMSTSNTPSSTGGALGEGRGPVTTGGGGANASRGGTPPWAVTVDSGLGHGGIGGLRAATAGTRLLLGGGAGSTYLPNMGGGAGGNGGGIVIVIAGEVTGDGSLSARGTAGPRVLGSLNAMTYGNGSSGAGGSVLMQVEGALHLSSLDARGANGATITGCCAAGAAGGAGRIFVTASEVDVEPQASSGTLGTVDGEVRDGSPLTPYPGEVEVRETGLTDRSLRFAIGCSASPANVLCVLGVLLFLARRQKVSSKVRASVAAGLDG